MKDLKIGDIITYNEKQYIAAKSNISPCSGCAFMKTEKHGRTTIQIRCNKVCDTHTCYLNEIIFKKVKNNE